MDSQSQVSNASQIPPSECLTKDLSLIHLANLIVKVESVEAKCLIEICMEGSQSVLMSLLFDEPTLRHLIECLKVVRRDILFQPLIEPR